MKRALVFATAIFLAATTSAGCPHAGQIVLQTGQCVLDSGVFAAVLADLVQANYAALIADAVARFTPQLVTCALQAITASEQGPSPAGSSAGSGKQAIGPVYDPQIVARAKEMLAKYQGAH